MTRRRDMIITLFVVALLCSVVLSLVFAFTQPRIEATKKKLTQAGLSEVMKTAYEFTELIPETLWQATDSSDSFIGIVFRVFPRGYGGLIPITVGLDPEGRITKIRIASAAEGLKETPGLGVKITEPEFTGQFVNKAAADIKLKKDGGTIDAITAATISSRAVCNGIFEGIKKYHEYLALTIDPKRVFPDAGEFSEIIKDTLWYALRDSDTLGIVFIGITRGYADDIKFMVGLDRQERITGIEIVYANETTGLGETIKEKEFLDRFKTGKPETITGATISSQAVIEAVTGCRERFKGFLR
jgi:electron transport complex protein RnfG